MKLFGVPITINLSFFIIIAFLGFDRLSNPAALVIWIVVATFSILVHEFGHAGVGKLFGLRPSIMLHGMGGLTTWEATTPLPPLKDIAVSLAGPIAGFIVGGLAFAVGAATGLLSGDSLIATVFSDLLWVNFGWGLLNLIPMLPLDGGRVMRGVLELIKPDIAVKGAHIISVVFAVLGAGLALWAGTLWGVFLAGWMGWMNVSALLSGRGETPTPRVVPKTARPATGLGSNAPSPTPVATTAIFNEAQAALAADDVDGAIRRLQQVLDNGTHGQRVLAFEMLAWCHLRKNNFPEASRMLDNLPRDYTPNPRLVGIIALRTNHPEDAITPLARALNATPEADTAMLLGEAYARMGQPDKAWRLHTVLGETLASHDLDMLEQALAFHTGQLERSIAVGERVFQAHANPDSAYNVACTHARLNNFDEALRWLDRALDAGLQPAAIILTDPDLAAIRKQPGFDDWFARRVSA